MRSTEAPAELRRAIRLDAAARLARSTPPERLRRRSPLARPSPATRGHLRSRSRPLVRRSSPAGAGLEIETLVILEAHDDPIAHHHTLGGRKVSALDPSLKGLPVLPFAVMAEMTAQAAALAVTPGLVLTGLDAGACSQMGALRG